MWIGVGAGIYLSLTSLGVIWVLCGRAGLTGYGRVDVSCVVGGSVGNVEVWD